MSLVDDAMEQVAKLFKANREVAEQLAAVTARAEKAEARLSTIGLLLPVMTDTLAAGTGQAARSAEFAAKAIAHHHRGEIGHVAADAAQDGLSATETDAEGSQASRNGNSSATPPEEPSERCPCGCPKIGDGCNCRYCNEPYPTRQPDDDTTEQR